MDRSSADDGFVMQSKLLLGQKIKLSFREHLLLQ